MSNPVYLDHNATSPCLPEAAAAMHEALSGPPGNPSSMHTPGHRAAEQLAAARRHVAAFAGCKPEDVVFTSGGTESNRLALLGVLAARPECGAVVVSSVEHPSLLDVCSAIERPPSAPAIRNPQSAICNRVLRVPVDAECRPDLAALKAALTKETALVSVMMANNETGSLLPVDEIGELCRTRGIPFHTDAVQAAGKVALDFAGRPFDLMSLSAHKFGGPAGVGALIVREDAPYMPGVFWGHQERGRRGGTENLPGIVGMGEACRVLGPDPARRMAKIAVLRDRLENEIMKLCPETVALGSGGPRVANTVQFVFGRVDGNAMLLLLDADGIAASSGSACTAGTREPSHVLRAMGVSQDRARGALRLSLGTGTTAADIDRVLECLPKRVAQLRSKGGKRR